MSHGIELKKMIINQNCRRYPIKPFKLKSYIPELIDGVPIVSPPADLSQRNFFFGDTHHGGAHMAQPAYILYKFAQHLRGWKSFTRKELDDWVEKNEVFGKNDPDMFCGQNIWPRDLPIHLMEQVNGRYYFRHRFACELARAYWDMGRIDESEIMHFPIRPFYIRTEGKFSGEGGTPFCNPNIARDARILLNVFQRIRIYETGKETKSSGGRWRPVSLTEIRSISDRKTGTPDFFPESLIRTGLLEQISGDFHEQLPENMFLVTGKFVLECFISSPEEYFFLKEEKSSTGGDLRLISAVTPY